MGAQPERAVTATCGTRGRALLLQCSHHHEYDSVHHFCFFTALVSLCGAVAAETRYVSDDLEVTLRTGQSTSHQIVRMVKSGTAVEALETDANTGYSKVRTPSGSEGWVLSRYLMTAPSARQQLSELQRRLAELEIENKQLKEQSGTLKQQSQSADQHPKKPGR